MMPKVRWPSKCAYYEQMGDANDMKSLKVGIATRRPRAILLETNIDAGVRGEVPCE